MTHEVHGTLFFGSTSHFLELFPEAVVKKDRRGAAPRRFCELQREKTCEPLKIP